MGWKDLFYFRRNEKIAVIFLLILIVFSSILYFISDIYTYNQNNNEEDLLAQSEFDDFQKNLKPIYYQSESATEPGEDGEFAATKSPKNTKTNSTKLTEGQTVDLNAANIGALKKVPGIGDAYAKRIIEYRELLGGYLNIEQLLEVQGISKKKLENFSSYFTIKKKVRKMRINKLSAEQLSKHPYISEKQAQNIVQKRDREKIGTADDLRSADGFSPRDVDMLIHYISFE
ncbi:helix-hairpin-helix domain-containing protein [Dysgonomonas sp. 520]|uniref:helix-hairpin-helix domain-containing protein n=1 Tax=Dysgonomonas sp. 520 TaxID=2302931 RepID=UPI0013D3B2FD|nr:helix-hairpin-helix domain-containing protein [Dysgonomonas sp. 520]NDW10398.1 hypothetical protein [Dysgonomonas sp. 520]